MLPTSDSGASDAPGAKRAKAHPVAVGMAAAIVVAIYLAHAIDYWPQINDDAFITFRYAKFLSLGRGPYFNVGEHVEGYTNTSMMLLMAGVDAVMGDTRLLAAAKVFGIACGLATLLFTALLCRAWLRKIDAMARDASVLAWGAAALVASQSGFALNSTTGLETTLFSACIVGGLWLAQDAEDRDRWRGCGALFGLAVLTRPEGLPVFVAVWVARLWGGDRRDARFRRRLLLDAALVAGAAAGLLAFRWFAYDGELLPNTYYAKSGGMGGQISASTYLLGFVRKHLAYVGWLPALFVLTTRERALLRNTLPSLFVVGFGVVSIFLAGPDWMPGYRLLAPYLPAWAALSVLGVCVLVGERLPVRRTATAIAVCGALVGALYLWQSPARTKYHDDCRVRARGYAQGHALLADWLRSRSKPGETVALMDIGIVGFRCIDLRILDVTGLTDRFIAKSPGGFLDKRFDPSYVFDRPPEFLVIALTGAVGRDIGDPGPLVAWSPVERRLAATPEFRALYVHPRTAPAGADPLEVLAASVGALRVFEHAYPGRRYFLCVYARGT
jgi:arabinofuranosyltransferase